MIKNLKNKTGRYQTKHKGVFLNSPVVASMIILLQMIADKFGTGKAVTLTLDHLNIEQIDTTDPTQVIYEFSNLPLGLIVTGGTESNGVISFTHQDILEGKITLTIIDPNQIDGMTLDIINAELLEPQSVSPNSDDLAKANFAIQDSPVPLQVIIPEDYNQTDPEENNDIDLSEINMPFKINGDKGDDTILTGSGDDVVDGGEGNDKIDLSAGGKDKVIYGIGSARTIYAHSGADIIYNFKRGEDIFLFQAVDKILSPPDLDAFLDSMDGNNSNEIQNDDRLIVSLNFDYVNDGQGGLNLVVSGLTLNFRIGFISSGGRISSPTVKIYFDQAIAADDFITLIGGPENIDQVNLALKKLSDLKTILGEHSVKYEIIDLEPDLQGDDQDNSVTGSADDDKIDGGDGDDHLDGGEGSDTLDGGEGADTINGGDSFYSYFNFVDYSQSPAAVRVALNGPKDDEGFVIGHSGGHAEGDRLQNIDNLRGSRFDDILIGDSQRNRIEGDAGADTIDGFEDNNWALYTHSDAAVTVALNGPVNQDGFTIGHSGGHAEGDKLKNIISIGGSRFDDNLIGDENKNWFEGFYGADKIDGGESNDWSDYQNSYAGVRVALNGPIDDEGFVTGHSGGHAKGDRLKNIESIRGSQFNDILIGDDGCNWLGGDAGDDILYGLSGNDVLLGNDGNDIIYGGTGNDTLLGWIGDDELYGGDGHDTLDGWDGDDKLQGGAGNNLLFGWDGHDEFIVEVIDTAESLDLVQDFTSGEDQLNIYISILNEEGEIIKRDYIVDDGDDPSINDINAKLATFDITYSVSNGSTVFNQNGEVFLILDRYTSLIAQDFASGTDLNYGSELI